MIFFCHRNIFFIYIIMIAHIIKMITHIKFVVCLLFDIHVLFYLCSRVGFLLYCFIFHQRKGLPYCHKPCYARLFGPQMMGYGSNVVSPANFKRNGDGTLYNGEYDFDLKQVFESGEMIHNNGGPSWPSPSPQEKLHSHDSRPTRLGAPNQIMEFDFMSEPDSDSQNFNGSPNKSGPQRKYTQRE